MNRKSCQHKNVDSTVENILRTENILHLLQALEIGTFANINIFKEIAHNPINKSTLIRIPNNACASETDILLNVKQGRPTVDQVYEAIYQRGSDCHQCIIVFTGGNNYDDKYNPSADVDTVKCLIDNMNRYKLNIYLVQMVYNSTSSICDYKVLVQPDSHSEFNQARCPTKEKFTVAEFWNVYFWGYNNWVEATPFEFGFDSKSEFDLCYPAGDMNVVTEWTGEGGIIRIKDTNDNNKNELDAIWNAMKSEILDMFKGCDIELLMRAGVIIKLRITVFDKPIADLAGTPWREKRHYAGLMWTKFTQCYEFFERALQDPKNIGEINNGKT